MLTVVGQRLIFASWNITSMITAGTVKWPTNTFKEYIDIDSGAWGPLLDVNDTFIYPYDDYFWINASDVTADLTPVALDYFYDRPDPIDDDNYGWTLPLHYDEYPLEIQCSQCFLYVIFAATLTCADNIGTNSCMDSRTDGVMFGSMLTLFL